MPALIGTTTLHAPDAIVLGAYLALLIATGLWFSRRAQTSTNDYFLAGRSMPVWAVSLSVLATSLSAATFVGAPQQAYAGDLTYLSASIGGVLAVLIVALLFIPAFYRSRVGTIYELVGRRLGEPARRATSAAFMGGRLLASGARLYIAALAGAMVLFGDTQPGHVLLAIAVMTLVGIAYTLVGGIGSVIWTDVIQAFVFLVAVLAAIALLLHSIPLHADQIIDALANTQTDSGRSKLTLLRLDADPRAPYTLWTALIGFTLLGIASYGVDQDLTQRMLTCRSAVRGGASAILAILAGIPVVALFMLVGLLLHVFYNRPDLMGLLAVGATPDDSRTVFLRFIMDRMPPGLTGLMFAGVFAAGLSSLNSAINAMASTLVTDFYRPSRPDLSERHYLKIARLSVVAWGVVLGLFAGLCLFWQRAGGQSLIDFALGVMGFAYAGLLAVFFTALLSRRGSSRSAIAAIVVGAVAVGIQQPALWNLIDQSGWSGRVGPFLSSPAYPWKLTFATALATGVCLLGRRRT